VVTNVADYSTDSVAELVAGATIAEVRNLCQERERAASGDVSETSFDGRSVGALTIGVIGAGNIGSRLARLMADGFGSTVLYWSRHRREALESDLIKYTQLEELLGSADVVSIHLAASGETADFLDEARIARLPAGAVLVNTAPNELVDLEAVKSRCREGSLRYVMDHADELSDSERADLGGTPNVTIYPPIGYATREADANKTEILISNIETYLKGNARNRVN
jgi:D-lactate dehydrogenase